MVEKSRPVLAWAQGIIKMSKWQPSHDCRHRTKSEHRMEHGVQTIVAQYHLSCKQHVGSLNFNAQDDVRWKTTSHCILVPPTLPLPPHTPPTLLPHFPPHPPFSSPSLLILPPHPPFSSPSLLLTLPSPHPPFSSPSLLLTLPSHPPFSSPSLLLTLPSPHPPFSSPSLLLTLPSPHPPFSSPSLLLTSLLLTLPSPHPPFSSPSLLLTLPSPHPPSSHPLPHLPPHTPFLTFLPSHTPFSPSLLTLPPHTHEQQLAQHGLGVLVCSPPKPSQTCTPKRVCCHGVWWLLSSCTEGSWTRWRHPLHSGPRAA